MDRQELNRLAIDLYRDVAESLEALDRQPVSSDLLALADRLRALAETLEWMLDPDSAIQQRDDASLGATLRTLGRDIDALKSEMQQLLTRDQERKRQWTQSL